MQAFLHHIDWAVAMRTQWLTPVFKAFTLMGYSTFIMLFIITGFWVVNKQIFARTGLVVGLSALLNAYLKLVFQDPRPDAVYWLDPRISASYGFPSGHAQIAVVLWGWIAWESGKKWVWGVCLFLTAGICFSRLYLGVHDVEDVLGGAAIGALTLVVFGLSVSRPVKRLVRLNAAHQVMVLVVLTAVALWLWPQKDVKTVMAYGGFLIGLWTGVGLERRTVDYGIPPQTWRKIVVAALGLFCFALLKKALQSAADAVAPDQPVLVLTLGLILGFYATFFVPWTFIKLKFVSASTAQTR